MNFKVAAKEMTQNNIGFIPKLIIETIVPK